MVEANKGTIMKNIVISLSIPEELQTLMEQDRNRDDPTLQNAIVETIWRHYQPHHLEARRPGFYGRLPDAAETGWGDAWSSRWTELKAERSARTRRGTIEPPPTDLRRLSDKK
jgi:hypothetical protein